jgi:hypothetical protein
VGLLWGQPPQNRTVLSEFHTYGPDAFYMLRELRHKYVYYLGAPHQLFDLEADPEELTDFGAAPEHALPRTAPFHSPVAISDSVTKTG